MIAVPDKTDVVVVGGGPGGSTAASMLCKAGYQVVLLEKEHHPRYVVGENLLPDFWRYTDEVGVSEKIEAEGFIRKSGGIVHWNGEYRATSFDRFGYTRPALHVERGPFDEILLRHAESEGAIVSEGVSATHFKHGGDLSRVDYRESSNERTGTIQCRYLVDASGQAGLLGRAMGLREFDDEFKFMSVWGYFSGGRYLDIHGQAHPRSSLARVPVATYITSLDDVGEKGWAWYIPLRNRTSVGLVVPREYLREQKTKGNMLQSYYLDTCRKLTGVGALLSDAEWQEDSIQCIRNYSYQSKSLAGPGYFMVGDAAGFVDPIFSVGITMALYSGHLAAWCIDRALKDGMSAERQSEFYSKSVKGRLEVARLLALPHYVSGREVSTLAKAAMRFERLDARELMFAASSMVTRAENFQHLMHESGMEDITGNRLTHLAGLTLS